MTQFLPPNLLALFAPREPIPYLPPPDKLPHEKKNVHNYIGIAQFVKGNFEDPKDTPPPTRVETRDERLERKKRDKEEQVAYKLEQEIALWDPTAAPDDAVTTDPFKTLFVGRINFYTSENKIRREFESYGPIKTIKMVHDKDTGKPKGYCFIEFEHERDMHCKYINLHFQSHKINNYSRIIMGSNMDCICKLYSVGKDGGSSRLLVVVFISALSYKIFSNANLNGDI